MSEPETDTMNTRPHLEYCVSVCNAYLAKDTKFIEDVQRRATKLVQDIRNWSYDERLQYLGLIRLDKRRVRSDQIETFKIMKESYMM